MSHMQTPRELAVVDATPLDDAPKALWRRHSNKSDSCPGRDATGAAATAVHGQASDTPKGANAEGRES